MKKHVRLHALASIIIAAAGFHAQVSAADSANAAATAELIAPIAITNTAGFNFGRVVPGGTSGTVQLSTAGVPTAGGGVTLGNTASAAAAAFTVTGEGTSTFSVSFSGGTLTDDAENELELGAFRLSVNSGADQTADYAGTLVAGEATLAVGATLSVPADAPTGEYSTGNDGGVPVTVTVAYN